MKKSLRYFLKSVVSLPLVLTLSSCGEQDGMSFDYPAARSTSITNVALDTLPTDLSQNVALNTVIKVNFLAPINPQSVDNFTFRIENENDIPMEGEITISDDYKQLSFARRIANNPAVWDPSTTYTVYTRFLKDSSGNYIGDKTFQFTTQAVEQGQSGNLKVERVTPTQETFLDYIKNIRPDSPITVEFNMPIVPNREVCDTPVLRNAIQLINVDIGDQNGQLSVPPMDAHICLTCSYVGYCNKIVATPVTPFRDDSLLIVMARPVSQFFGLNSSGGYESLSQVVTKERFVFFNRLWP